MLLDTNALSDLVEMDAALVRLLPRDRPWYLSSIVLGEYLFGVLKSDRRQYLERWIEEAMKSFSFLVPDADTARLYAELRVATTQAGHILPYHDLWIAALARQHNTPVMTRDAHFDKIPGIRCVRW